ncbi:transcription antitermination factor NusB [uncultured Fibrobacter sp.]|uniref:transcription antitermination factor NusB n=1 Tax=uncultured Fibrobacter sp. TaxID=261512 RepID=UPI002603D3FA|nr:transcription antitermination factor NusB [uncultured Fibrobacter sp.]
MLGESLKERMDAYRVLLLWQREGTFIKESGLSPFAMELALGVCRRHLYLQFFIRGLVKRMPSMEVSTVLELGLFQMFFMEVPDHAAVATSVDLAKAANLHEGSARLVNAVLHAARRSGLPKLPPQRIRRVSIENSVPEWLVRRWFDIYGGNCAEAMAKATLDRPAEWIRVNLQKTSAPVLAQKLGITGASILYDRYVQIPDGVKLKSLLESDSFARGEFSLQNPSAYQVVKLLDLKPGNHVWDACAAPGGKAALMAEMDSSLDILASDSSEARVLKMHDLVDRLGLSNVRVQCVDALSSNKGPFDRILLDVPCSNMGVIARRPESVYRLTPETIRELAELQYKLLESVSACLATDGILVYATCSPDPDETTKVVNRFVKENPEFEKVGHAVLPGVEDSRLDGFYAQALRRKK